MLTLAHACSRFVEVSEVLFGVSEVLFEVPEVLFEVSEVLFEVSECFFEVLHRHCSRLLTLAHACSRPAMCKPILCQLDHAWPLFLAKCCP